MRAEAAFEVRARGGQSAVLTATWYSTKGCPSIFVEVLGMAQDEAGARFNGPAIQRNCPYDPVAYHLTFRNEPLDFGEAPFLGVFAL